MERPEMSIDDKGECSSQIYNHPIFTPILLNQIYLLITFKSKSDFFFSYHHCAITIKKLANTNKNTNNRNHIGKLW